MKLSNQLVALSVLTAFAAAPISARAEALDVTKGCIAGAVIALPAAGYMAKRAGAGSALKEFGMVEGIGCVGGGGALSKTRAHAEEAEVSESSLNESQAQDQE